MNLHTSINPDLEAAYNVRAARVDYDELLADWNRRSEAYRAGARCRLDVQYGAAARSRLDVFPAGARDAVLVYLHGGYWQRGDKSAYSFLAAPYVGNGVSVVVMGYTLCPQTTVPGITRQIRAGLSWLYRNADGLGLAPDRVNVMGHSAGGHLTAMMLATNWAEVADGLPRDLVRTGIPVSGIYDLEPLRRTSINELAGIDEQAVRDCSPVSLPPAPDTRALAVVGGRETVAFHEQMANFTSAWSRAGARIEGRTEPDADHFDIVNRLADPKGKLFESVLRALA